MEHEEYEKLQESAVHVRTKPDEHKNALRRGPVLLYTNWVEFQIFIIKLTEYFQISSVNITPLQHREPSAQRFTGRSFFRFLSQTMILQELYRSFYFAIKTLE